MNHGDATNTRLVMTSNPCRSSLNYVLPAAHALKVRSLTIPRVGTLTMDLGNALSVAGLGLGAFSGIIDLLHACTKALDAWKSLHEMDDDIRLIRTRLMVQKESLEYWQRYWYDFGISGRASVQRLQLLKSRQDAVELALTEINGLMEKMEPLRQIAAGEEAMSAADRVKWLSGKREETDRWLGNIEPLIDGLYRFLPPRMPNYDLAQVVLSLDSIDISGPGPSSGLPNSAAATRTVDLRRLEGALREDLEKRVAEFRNILPAPEVKFAESRVKLLSSDVVAPGLRSFGTFDGAPVIIEWKRYNSSWQGQEGINLRGRLDNLARLLRSDAKPEELLTLHCLGYFDALQTRRFGFAFSYAAGCDSSMISLKELLDSRTSLPTLEERYRAAYSLSLSLAIIHTAEWLHKSIRSHNVLLPKQQGRVVWSRPYLVGFEYSRPDKPGELSEKAEESARYNLYRHLQSQGTPSESFRKAFDMYSLGVVMLEIGLWRSGWKLRTDEMTAQSIHDNMLRGAKETLAHFMGEEYRDATVKCLNGDLEKRPMSVLRAFWIEVVEVLARCLKDEI
jgi:serine/threonine protein kinase